MNELVSIIVPTLNRPGYLARALASIRAQTYRNYEIIVVNDGGEDVRGLCDLFGPIVYVHHKSTRGLPTARNDGIRRATGELIAYLDDDDVWLPRHLEKLVKFKAQSRCRLVYSDSFFWVDERDFQKLLSVDYSREELLKHNLTPVCSILHERELWNQAGKFNPDLPNHEDYDLWLRMSAITPFEHLPEVTALYSKRNGSDQMSMDLTFMAINRRKIQERYIESQAAKEKKSMKVRAVITFDDHKVHRLVQEGEIFELPEGVDWLKAGFVVPIPGVEVETAVQPVPERSKPVRRRKAYAKT